MIQNNLFQNLQFTNTISVIIPTMNREKDLIETVSSMLNQTRLPNELIIVDGSDNMNSKSAIERLFNQLYLDVKNRIKLVYTLDTAKHSLTWVRNVGITKSSCNIVLFLDDDVILDKKFIQSILETYQKYQWIDGVGGVIINYKTHPAMLLFFRLFHLGDFKDKRQEINGNLNKYIDKDIIKVSKLCGSNMSFKRGIFNRVRFDELYRGYSLGEDIDFCYRLSKFCGCELVMTPRAKLYHKRSPINRMDLKKRTEADICAYYYFFIKNVDKCLNNWIFYIWLNVWFITFACLEAIIMRTTAPIRGITSGYIKVLNGLRDCEFIALKKKEAKK